MIDVVVVSFIIAVFFVYCVYQNKKIKQMELQMKLGYEKINDLNTVISNLLTQREQLIKEVDRAVVSHDGLVYDYNNLLKEFVNLPKIKLFTVKPLEFFKLEKSNLNNAFLNELTNYVSYLESIINYISEKYPQIIEGISKENYEKKV